MSALALFGVGLLDMGRQYERLAAALTARIDAVLAKGTERLAHNIALVSLAERRSLQRTWQRESAQISCDSKGKLVYASGGAI